MSSSITWPEALPVPLMGSKLNNSPRNIRTEMESGRVRNRRVYLEPMEHLEVQWNFTEDEFSTFKVFFDQTISNGSRSFMMEVFGEETEMAFAEGNYSFSRSDNLVSVVATLEYLPIVPDMVVGGEGGDAIGGEGGDLVGQEVPA